MSVNPGFGGQSFIEPGVAQDRACAQVDRRQRPRHTAAGRRRHQGGEYSPRSRRRCRHLRCRQCDLRQQGLSRGDRRDAANLETRASTVGWPRRWHHPSTPFPGAAPPACPGRAAGTADPSAPATRRPAHRQPGAGAQPGRRGHGRTRARPDRAGADQSAHPRYRGAAGDRQAAHEPGLSGASAEPAHVVHRQPRHRQDHGSAAHGGNPASPRLRAQRPPGGGDAR